MRKRKWDLLAARLGGHYGDNVLLGVDPDLRELDVVREHLPPIDELNPLKLKTAMNSYNF